MAAPPWLAAARQAAVRGPCAPRDALRVGGETVGSIAPEVAHLIAEQRLLDERYQLSKVEQSGEAWWALLGGDATSALNALAHALRAADRCGAWRDEQLAVCNAQGARVGTIERGAVRVLGLATQAVHLVGATADGTGLWVQQRAFNKPNNPGMWDTLMGGMVSAADTVPQALERETWEEAGLRIDALQPVVHGGHVDFARPSREAGGTGYMVERIDWFHATVPEGMAPVNQDGEVERFERLPHAAVQAQLAQGAFTAEAALVLAAFYGW
ncbi:MAG: NUDIX domain-containing protein [Comamonadaceae bacterium]|nr:MAG: NUDIX domain-containing protein [Comamonadaceae bacterium]